MQSRHHLAYLNALCFKIRDTRPIARRIILPAKLNGTNAIAPRPHPANERSIPLLISKPVNRYPAGHLHPGQPRP